MTIRVVVVGSGLAGLTCALHAAAAGARVTVLTKGAADDAATTRAQGGIAAALTAPDSPDAHFDDTMIAGAHAGSPGAVRVLVDKAAARIDELRRHGVQFDLDSTGRPALGLEAAHAHARVLHAGGDATGSVIQAALLAAVHRAGIDVRTGLFARRLLVDDDQVVGVGARTAPADADEVVDADAVVLATGGAGQLYAHTTNPLVATGDGLALALSVGAAVADLEFVQFHPTMLSDGFLISEAVRGEGASLIDDSGHRFAFDAHPDGELAPRDVVARAICDAMRRQGGRPVRLDATGLRRSTDETREFLARRFPTIDRAVRARGWDWARHPIPVTPGAHYLMGGIVTDLHGRTGVPGLYAVGEVARTGVHGANRLASNSLLEAAVFGARAGDRVVDDRQRAWPVPTRDAAPPAAQVPDAPTSAAPDDAPAFSRRALQELAWRHLGPLREATGLRAAARTLDHWLATTPPARTVTELEDANMLRVARAIAAAALARRRSLGAHWRADDAPIAATASIAHPHGRAVEGVPAC